VTYVFTSNVAELATFADFVLASIPPRSRSSRLAVDLGTDLVTALALGAEPPESGTPSARRGPRVLPSWTEACPCARPSFLGPIKATLGLAGFFFVYRSNGWRLRDAMADGGPALRPGDNDHLYAESSPPNMKRLRLQERQFPATCDASGTRSTAYRGDCRRTPRASCPPIYVPPCRPFLNGFAGSEGVGLRTIILPVLLLLDEARRLVSARVFDEAQ
jgi:hypothetical protein